MTEPIITVGLGAVAAYLGKDGISRILGPTADYLGGELKEFTKRRIENVAKIFSRAEKKLGDKLDCPGQVPPKVLKTIINEGSYSDDDITIEYFGGVLASSRTEISRDDRGARLAKMIDNMSAYQIRSHYLIYSTISEIFSNSKNSFGLHNHRKKMELFIPHKDYFSAMDFTQQELDNPQILSHIFYGLHTDGLIDTNWKSGEQGNIKRIFSNAPSDGTVCTPSTLGVELLLWAFGHGDQHLNFLLTDDFSADIEGIPKSVSNAIATKNITDESS